MDPIAFRTAVIVLRLEGAVAFAAGLAGSIALSDGWITLAMVALAPDLAMLGYAFGPKVGGRLYNIAHTHLVPAALGVLGLWAFPPLLPVACVWLAHIGMDRALGYGLKSETSFRITHLGRLGRAVMPEQRRLPESHTRTADVSR